MKKLLWIILLLCTFKASAQLNADLIKIGKYYMTAMSINVPDSVKIFNNYKNTQLAFTAGFITQMGTERKRTTNNQYLNRPSDTDLKNIFIIEQINYNLREKKPVDNIVLVDSLLKQNITAFEMLHVYYSILFSTYDRSDPFDMSAVNYTLDNYELKNDTEKGVFFLESMSMNGTLIWGYMNIPKPPRYSEALKYIANYPKYNSDVYYKYLSFDFDDFYFSRQHKQISYKSDYLSKLYQTLLYHFLSLKVTGSDVGTINDVLYNSILMQQKYFKYSTDHELLQTLYDKTKKQ